MHHLNQITYHMACSLHDHYTDRLAAASRPGEKLFVRSQLKYYKTFIANF